MALTFKWRQKRSRYKPERASKPVRLLIEVRAFDKGGLERVVLDTATSLDPDHFRVVMVSMSQPGDLGRLAEAAGIKIYQVTGINRKRRYQSILRGERINLTNSHFSGYGYPLFKKHKIPNITFIHNVYAFLDRKMLSQMRSHDPCVKTYISVSPNATRYATRKIGLPEHKFVTIPNGLRIEEHQSRLENLSPVSRQSLGIAENDYVFLNVASYNLHKGHYLMAEAMKKILQTRTDLKIVCIGNVVHPPHVDALKCHLRREGIDQHLLLPGYFPNVEAYYTMADAFVLPSFVEGWSIAMNEAMFYEKPMILTDTGAASEVIRDNDIGKIIPNEYRDILNLDCPSLDSMAFDQRHFKTSDNLVEAMLDFADNREYWRQAGKRGRQKIIRHYSFSRVVEQYEKVFLQVAMGEGCRLQHEDGRLKQESGELRLNSRE